MYYIENPTSLPTSKKDYLDKDTHRELQDPYLIGRFTDVRLLAVRSLSWEGLCLRQRHGDFVQCSRRRSAEIKRKAISVLIQWRTTEAGSDRCTLTWVESVMNACQIPYQSAVYSSEAYLVRCCKVKNRRARFSITIHDSTLLGYFFWLTILWLALLSYFLVFRNLLPGLDMFDVLHVCLLFCGPSLTGVPRQLEQVTA